MRLSSIVLLFLLGVTLPASAQGVSETASHDMITNVLHRTAGRFGRDGENYTVEIGNRSFTLLYLEKGSKLVAKAPVKGMTSLQAINRYNEKAGVATRAVHLGKQVVLEAGVDCSLGITEAGLQKFMTRYVKDLADFEAFVAANQASGGGDPVVPVLKEKRTPPIQTAPNSDDKEFIITFPTYDPAKWETAWKIVWDMETAKMANDQGFKFPKGRDNATVLFKIKKAYYKPGQQAPWIQVLEDAHPSEFYVPYYFRGTRFYDLKGVGGYTQLSPKEGGAVSQVLSKGRRVMCELRDTGPAYKHGSITRRGEELTLWANFGAANYTYMVEYGFKDDGGIVFRHSPTGYNYFNHFDASHMHGSFWRVGMKLGPDGNNDKNQVYVVKLPTDPKLQGDGGKLDIQEVTKESFYDWNAEEFTRIRVTNPNVSIVPAGKDRAALPISYDLVTNQQGIARHRRFADEKFSHHDFWVTRHDSPEKMYVNLGTYFFGKNGDPNPNLQDLNQQNVVLWHSSSALHTPRGEDGIVGGNSVNNGQAIVYWTTFELRPRNLFTKTPIYRSLP